MVQEDGAAHLVPGKLLVSPQLSFHHHLGSDACMVAAWVPQYLMSLHLVPAATLQLTVQLIL